MGILDEFNPRRDGWSFVNWGEANDFTWDLYRRTYLAINPTNDPIESPLDVAFFQIFKSCASNGNCGGMAMLALALFKYGGYMGFCSPPNFYAPANDTDHKAPARQDLHEAINIMQARQFSAPGIRNFLDVVKAGQLNDGVAAWHRIQSGLVPDQTERDRLMQVGAALGRAGLAAHLALVQHVCEQIAEGRRRRPADAD